MEDSDQADNSKAAVSLFVGYRSWHYNFGGGQRRWRHYHVLGGWSSIRLQYAMGYCADYLCSSHRSRDERANGRSYPERTGGAYS